MKTVIIAWAKYGMQEFFLPGIHNADHRIHFEKEMFRLEEDLDVKLEIYDEEWRIFPDETYVVKNEREPQSNRLEDGSLYTLAPVRGHVKLSLLVVQKENLQVGCRKYDVFRLSRFRVGSSENNQLRYIFQNYISREHALFVRQNDSWTIYDQSGNGTFVNGRRVKESQRLRFGDSVVLFGLKLICLGDLFACSVVGGSLEAELLPVVEIPQERGIGEPEKEKKKRYYKSAPRTIEPLFTDAIEIEGPPAKKQRKRKPLLLTIGPSFTMVIPMALGSVLAIVASRSGSAGSSAFMYTGLVTAMGSAGFGVLWAVKNMRYAAEEAKEEEALRCETYGQYIAGKTEEIRRVYEENRRGMFFNHPSGEECCQVSDAEGLLWNRNPLQEDFLTVRLGQGTVPFQGKIEVPKPKFEMFYDELTEKPAMVKDHFTMLYQVPICLNLLQYPMVGVIGGSRKIGAYIVIRNIIAQLAANTSYTDVKMIFIYDGSRGVERKRWEFVKWLPHVWSEDMKTRYIAQTKADVGDISFSLGTVLRSRAEEAVQTVEKQNIPRPWYVLFLISPEMLEGELISRYVTKPRSAYGLTTFWLGERYEDLPNNCVEIIQRDGAGTGMFHVYEGRDHFTPISFDTVSSDSLRTLAQRVCGLRVAEEDRSGGIPTGIDFLEMYHVSSVEELHILQRWKKNKVYESMRVLVGQKNGAQGCYLDIHEKYHGPHGLVAGTTGSGKSESLQTYMLSLAVNFSPDDVAFFIIDFKGGGMANLFTGLPHLAGQISNLSGNQVHRAMVSIKSENRRRQKIFNDHSVNNINSYTRLYKNGEAAVPIPHLLIIIDEFAELKREEPDFMKELISVAQVGRSLGVHLILATQKPEGTVDDNIWSNTKFRWCLRVQDKKDSMGMLHRPDAAYITQAGRGYLQVGNDEIFELFQSGYSGAVYEKGTGAGENIAEMITITGKKVMTGSRTKREHREAQKRKWYEDLGRILEETAGKYQVQLEQLAEIMGEDSQCLEDIYESIAKAGYVYEKKPYNTANLKSFVKYMHVGTDALLLLTAGAGVRLPECEEITQLQAVIDHVTEVAAHNHYHSPQKLWLPVLPRVEYLQLPGQYQDWHTVFELKAPVGTYDDPANQEQGILEINFGENGHQVVYGSVASGKSTFLQTAVCSLMRKYAPDQLQFYFVDYGSKLLTCFADAPHTGGIVTDGEPDRLRILCAMLSRMLDERKAMLEGGSYSQYVRIRGPVLPAVVVVLDNYGNFREKTQDAYEPVLLRLLKEGISCGIYCLFSAAGVGMHELPLKLAENMQHIFALEMGDSYKYGEVLRVLRPEVLPEAGIKGRGLSSVNGEILEFQTALAIDAADDFERGRKLADMCQQMKLQWRGCAAMRIPEIPTEPEFSRFLEEPGVKKALTDDRSLPVGYRKADASIYCLDLGKIYTYVISGKGDTGKKNLLKLLMLMGTRKSAQIVVIEEGTEELKEIAGRCKGTYVHTQEEVFWYFQNLLPEFIRRNKIKRQCLEQGMEDAQIFERMQKEPPIFICIADLNLFLEDVYRKLPNGADMYRFVENIAERGKNHHIYLFGCMRSEDEASLAGRKIYQCFADNRTGIHLGGNLAAQRIFNFTNVSFVQQNKAQNPGSGMVPSREDSALAETVILPLVRGNDG